MKFTINMTCDNAAFDEPPEGMGTAAEVARILRKIARNLDDWNGYDKFQTIHDINGNDVGRWKLGS